MRTAVRTAHPPITHKIVGLVENCVDAKRVSHSSIPNIHIDENENEIPMLFVAALGVAGCADYYAGYPGYGAYSGSGPYYGGPNYGRPYYGGYPDPLRWQSVIALITLVVPDIGRAIGITSGSLDIGFIGTGRKFGVAVTTLCADIDRATKERRFFHPAWVICRLRAATAGYGRSPPLNISNDRRNQAPACQTKTDRRGQAA
jgi:hypothetical protein